MRNIQRRGGIFANASQIGIEGDASESNHVQQAEKWCSHVLGIQDNDRDCLWFKRLAETYQELRCSDEAIENFKKVSSRAEQRKTTKNRKKDIESRGLGRLCIIVDNTI